MDRAHREALGVQLGASEKEIKAAYRKLVLEHHPDRHLSSSPAEQAAAAQRFKVITEAYDFLTNPNERARSAYGASSSGPSASSSSSSRAYHYNVNTDWSHSNYEAGGSGYTSTISRWEWWKRAARHGARNFSQTLHVGLAVVLIGGGLMFEYSHAAIWSARNKGKSFEEMHASIRDRQQAQANSSGEKASQSPEPQQEVFHIRSSWADSMRGRFVPPSEADQRTQAGAGGANADARAAEAVPDVIN